MRFKCFLLLLGLGLLFGPGTRQTPLSVPPAKAADRAAPAKAATTLEERWKQLAGGAAVWRRGDARDPLQQFVFDMVAERVHAGNGEITREQFLAMGNQPAAPARPAPAAERPKREGRRPADPAPDAAQPKKWEDSGPVPGAEAEFRKRDLNGDGLLSPDEMSADPTLYAERDRWDTNNDGFIDLNEFKEYLRARRLAEREAERAARKASAEPRAPKLQRGPPAEDLPEGLPPWFKEYDIDGDGQIGLYEWRKAGQPTDRFREMDENGDGFLTPDEVLAFLHKDDESQPGKGKKQPKQAQQNAENQAAAEWEQRAVMRALRNELMMREQVIQLNGNNGIIIHRKAQ